MASASWAGSDTREFDAASPVTLTELTLDLVIICNMTVPKRSLKSFMYQQERSKVILEKIKFVLEKSKSQSLSKQIVSEL